MKYIADLHVHSYFSRATAKNSDLENLYIAAQLKGITVVATGDFTHPGWFAEIREKLVPAEAGLFKLNDEIAQICDKQVPSSCRGNVRFILVSEISNIYKKNGKTRKNHNLVFLPDLDSVYQFNLKLDGIGNIKSDGRPILGLDARDLLEILLETSDQGYLIPAHIWTPWFSVLGSKSGFDSIDECFGDLSHYIFAAETGLSSDPPMNRRVSGLDSLTLVSNSDAHSPMNLGREANLLNTELSYPAIKSAIKSGDPKKFLGTFEFYPEEGKYHMDGHRKCNVCLSPDMTIQYKGICPECGKPLTLGVLYRVEELADRRDGGKIQKSHPFYSIIPLSEILSEILKVGPKSKKVQNNYKTALESLGPEFLILHTLPPDAIDKAGIPLLSEAVKRMRRKKVKIFPGYDGEYGKIKVFEPEEIDRLLGQKSLFIMPPSGPLKNKKINKKKRVKDVSGKVKKQRSKPDKDQSQAEKKEPEKKKPEKEESELLSGLNKEQLEAVAHQGGPLLITAGPGTGKTRTLTHRIAYLVKERGVLPDNILALTFTNKAAQEMLERLKVLMHGIKSFPFVGTFHSFCIKLLKDIKDESDFASNHAISKYNINIIDDNDRKALVSDAISQVRKTGIAVPLKPDMFLQMIITAKQQILGPEENLESIASEFGSNTSTLSCVYEKYQNLLFIQGLCDYEDLIFKIVKLLESNKNISGKYKDIFKFIFVDEYQDLNQGQYRVLRALTCIKNNNLCVIGDPDQSIYGFRGSDIRYFKRFIKDFPQTRLINLTRNYRSAETILKASYQVIRDHRVSKSRIYSGIGGIKRITVLELETEKAEAVALGKTIEKMVGGLEFHSVDFGKVKDSDIKTAYAFSDFAVLYRTGAQSKIICDVFDSAGIPYQLVSKENAFCSKGISELVSFLKIINGSASYGDFDKIIKFAGRGIGKKTSDAFKNWCYENNFTLKDAVSNSGRFFAPGIIGRQKCNLYAFLNQLADLEKGTAGMSVQNMLLYLSEKTKIEEMVKENPKSKETFNSLITISSEFGCNLSDFLIMIAVQSDTDTYDFQTQKVALMSMHASKGLEFPVVFIAGCEKGYIPYKRDPDENFDINEERRLFYVAMTRAMDHLYLTYSKKRNIYGKILTRSLSPFVDDMEKGLKKYETPDFKNKKKYQVQLNLF